MSWVYVRFLGSLVFMGGVFMSAICDRCKVMLTMPVSTSFILMGRRIDLCLTCGQGLYDAIFEEERNDKKST